MLPTTLLWTTLVGIKCVRSRFFQRYWSISRLRAAGVLHSWSACICHLPSAIQSPAHGPLASTHPQPMGCIDARRSRTGLGCCSCSHAQRCCWHQASESTSRSCALLMLPARCLRATVQQRCRCWLALFQHSTNAACAAWHANGHAARHCTAALEGRCSKRGAHCWMVGRKKRHES